VSLPLFALVIYPLLSPKLLVGLIGALQAQGSGEKVVVVSNFTSSLDKVEALAGLRGWGEVLRIDGQVPTDRRQSLVDAFNRPSDRRMLFLLSSKAGGVGLNL
jgi:SNF2 family DNA or RNA helicase